LFELKSLSFPFSLFSGLRLTARIRPSKTMSIVLGGILVLFSTAFDCYRGLLPIEPARETLEAYSHLRMASGSFASRNSTRHARIAALPPMAIFAVDQ
jgi:hypothetical protein